MIVPGFVEHPMVTAVKLADVIGAPYTGQYQWMWLSPEVVFVCGLETPGFNRAVRQAIVERFRRAGFRRILFARHKRTGWVHFCIDTRTGVRRVLFEREVG